MKNFDRARRLGTIGDLESQLKPTLGILVILLRRSTRQRHVDSQGEESYKPDLSMSRKILDEPLAVKAGFLNR